MENPNFFHKIVNANRRRRFLPTIKLNEVWFIKENEIK